MNLPNPLIPGFNPDPSVVKVGDDYYLATSTFEYLPGMPIYHSRDFITWTQIGNVAARPGQVDVENSPTVTGVYAPTLRHHDGEFHLIVTDVMGRGMVHYTAQDAAGPWSDGDVVLDVDGIPVNGIDPDIAWDEAGTCYITYSGLLTDTTGMTGHQGIAQFRVDLATHRAAEPVRSMWSGTGGKFPEAPHLYQHDGHWYLLIAEGGTERGHSVSIARGDSPMGPFASAPGNPLLTARGTDLPVQNTGHGDLVVGPDGQWLIVLLGVRARGASQMFGALGRETFVTTVRWENGWPVFDKVELNPRPAFGFRDEFDAASFDDAWIGVRRFTGDIASLSERAGWAVLRAGEEGGMYRTRPDFIGRRQLHHTMTTMAKLDVSEGVGGLVVRYAEGFHYEVEAGGGRIIARAVIPGFVNEQAVSFEGAEVQLLLRSVPAKEAGLSIASCDGIQLGYVLGGEEHILATVDARYLSMEVATSFTGRVIGVYAARGTIAVDWFDYQGDNS
ncbi:glycoside hydrolase family 43 protein [Humibacter antri]